MLLISYSFFEEMLCAILLRFMKVLILDKVTITYHVGSLSPRHGTSSGCGWNRRPPYLEGSCEYIE